MRAMEQGQLAKEVRLMPQGYEKGHGSRWVSELDSAARGGYRSRHVTFDANAAPPLWSDPED